MDDLNLFRNFQVQGLRRDKKAELAELPMMTSDLKHNAVIGDL